MTDTSTQSSKKPSHVAYQVRDTGHGKKGYWNRIGVAWTTKGNGFSIQLESVPLDGRIVLRPSDIKEEA